MVNNNFTPEKNYKIQYRLEHPLSNGMDSKEVVSYYNKPGFENYHIDMIECFLVKYPELKDLIVGMTPDDTFLLCWIVANWYKGNEKTLRQALALSYDLRFKSLVVIVSADEIELPNYPNLNIDGLLIDVFGRELNDRLGNDESLFRYQFAHLYGLKESRMFSNSQLMALLLPSEVNTMEYVAKPDLVAEEMCQIKYQLNKCGCLPTLKATVNKPYWKNYKGEEVPEEYRGDNSIPKEFKLDKIDGRPVIITPQIEEPDPIWFAEELIPNKSIKSSKSGEVRRHISKYGLAGMDKNPAMKDMTFNDIEAQVGKVKKMNLF